MHIIYLCFITNILSTITFWVGTHLIVNGVGDTATCMWSVRVAAHQGRVGTDWRVHWHRVNRTVTSTAAHPAKYTWGKWYIHKVMQVTDYLEGGDFIGCVLWLRIKDRQRWLLSLWLLGTIWTWTCSLHGEKSISTISLPPPSFCVPLMSPLLFLWFETSC